MESNERVFVVLIVLLIAYILQLYVAQESEDEKKLSIISISHPYSYFKVTHDISSLINKYFEEWYELGYADRCLGYNEMTELIIHHKEALEKIISESPETALRGESMITTLHEEQTTLSLLEMLDDLFAYTDIVDADDLGPIINEINELIDAFKPQFSQTISQQNSLKK